MEQQQKANMEATSTGSVSQYIPGYSEMSKGERMDMAMKMTNSAKEEAQNKLYEECIKQAPLTDSACKRMRLQAMHTRTPLNDH